MDKEDKNTRGRMTDNIVASRMVELRPNIHLIKSEKAGSHVYLIRGDNKNVLIDTGMTANFPYLKASLQKLNLRPKDIHLIILTHEPADHIGATGYFFDTAVVTAHRLAANKIELQDEFVTLMKYCNVSCRPFHADLWLEDGSLIDLGIPRAAYASMRPRRICSSPGTRFSVAVPFPVLLPRGILATT